MQSEHVIFIIDSEITYVKVISNLAYLSDFKVISDLAYLSDFKVISNLAYISDFKAISNLAYLSEGNICLELILHVKPIYLLYFLFVCV